MKAHQIKIILCFLTISIGGCAHNEQIPRQFSKDSSTALTGYAVSKNGSIIIEGVNVLGVNNGNAALEFGASSIENNAWIDALKVWQSNDVYVCWENPSEPYKDDMLLVKNAVSASWETHSKLRFLGWNTCGVNSVGIRILIDDSGPHVKELGRALDGVQNGMVLNFDYNNWSQSCSVSEEEKRKCTYSIAVHEFGHAIGFAHEHNRPDTPGECTEEHQGEDGNLFLTSWDLDSVMNYCNPVYNNDGELSDGDKYAANLMYK